MPCSRYLVPFLLPWLAAARPIPGNADLSPVADAVTNANHIFNALHNSMRQFGSSLNHNGMSLFIATVPEGTELYHGTSKENRVNGTEWLAFEPEHALIFARGRHGPPPGRRPPGEGPPGHGPDGYGPPPGRTGQDEPKGLYFPDAVSDLPEPHRSDDQEHHRPGKDRPKHRDGKKGSDRGRPGKHHSDKGRPDKHRGPPCNGSRSDAPHHHPPPPYHDDAPSHRDGPSLPYRCPAGEGHLPCPPNRSSFRKGPNNDGRPHTGFDQHDLPSPFYKHHGPPLDEFQHRSPSPEGPEHRGPPPPHKFYDELSHNYHEDRKHDDGFSLAPLGFWAHRLGDLLRNPKRRDVASALPPTSSVQPETIEARGANGAFGTLFAEQEPLTEDDSEDKKSGYLHTYRTKHDLRLLYVDGQSAAKSKKGTLDTQDVLLLDNSIDHNGVMFGEKERANQMCTLARERWGNRVDGILRMEGGFEIILCDFGAHLDVVSIAEANPNAGGGFGGGSGDGFNYYRAVAARYHGIGGERVKLDYEHFVTAFAYPDAIHFDGTSRPRLDNTSATLDAVRTAVDKMILRKDDGVAVVDWQSVADMIVSRYADRIEYLASGSLDSFESLQAELDRALRPFIDYGARNSTREIERCAAQFMPAHTDTTTVAAQAVHQVAQTLCTSLVSASAQTDYDSALSTVRELKKYLAWTTWKQCRGCAVDEICFLPI